MSGLVLIVVCSGTASAQTPTQIQSQEQKSDSAVFINQNHYIRQGNVEIRDPAQKTELYAQLVELFEDENRAVATGNVLLAQGTNWISAERAEFNTKTWLA